MSFLFNENASKNRSHEKIEMEYLKFKNYFSLYI